MNATVKSIHILPLVYPEPHDLNRMRCIALARTKTSAGLICWGEAITMLSEAARAVKIVAEQGLAPC